MKKIVLQLRCDKILKFESWKLGQIHCWKSFI